MKTQTKKIKDTFPTYEIQEIEPACWGVFPPEEEIGFIISKDFDREKWQVSEVYASDGYPVSNTHRPLYESIDEAIQYIKGE